MRLAALALTLLTFPAFAATHVKARLVADVAQPQPGVPFHLGVLLTIDDGWHVYWKNPGESGMATTVRLHLPDGWKAEDVQYPIPELFDQGGVLSYGYQKEVMLISRVTPGKKTDQREPISASVGFLVCREVCLPGRITVQLDREPQPAQIANWLGKVPSKDLTIDWKPATQTADGWTQMHGIIPGPAHSNVQWFPSPPQGVMLQEIHATPQEVSFQMKKQADAIVKEISFDAVLTYETDNQREGVRVNVPLDLK